MGGATTGDGEGTGEERKGIYHQALFLQVPEFPYNTV